MAFRHICEGDGAESGFEAVDDAYDGEETECSSDGYDSMED